MDRLETGWTERHFKGLAGPKDTKNPHLAKVRLAGSNPVFRSNKIPGGIGDKWF